MRQHEFGVSETGTRGFNDCVYIGFSNRNLLQQRGVRGADQCQVRVRFPERAESKREQSGNRAENEREVSRD